MNYENNEQSSAMQTVLPSEATYVIIFELDRAQQSHVSIVNSADKSHTKITLVSSEYFNTTNTSTLVRGLIATTPAGLCSGAAGEWYQLGMKMPEEFFYPYLHAITDHLVPEKRPIGVKTPEIPTPSTSLHPAFVGKPVAPKLHIVFEVNRDKLQHVNFAVMHDGSYVVITMISPTEFDADVMSSLLAQLMVITPSGVCAGYSSTWELSPGTKLPQQYFEPYVQAIIDCFTNDDCDGLHSLMTKKTMDSPVCSASTLTGGLPAVSRPLIAPKPTLSSFDQPKPTLDQVYQEVVGILRTRGGHPAISMANSASTRKLYNHIDSITRRSLTFEENMEICRRLIQEIPATPPGYEPQRTRGKKF